VIHLYPRALGWLVRNLGNPRPQLEAVLWEMLPYGGTLRAANDD